ncbi:MAG: hypothetical protein MJ238_03395 [Bacilli bacterium]|nr:hypothetical protein [Bacilli bacterium]
MRTKRIILISTIMFALCSCSGTPTNAILREPAEVIPQNLIYPETNNETYKDYLSSVEAFSSNFTESCLKNFSFSEKENVAFSPISAYSSLALTSVCTGGDTSNEILSALKTDKTTLLGNYKKLYSSLELERHAETYLGEGKQVYKSHISNSVWIDSSVDFKDEALNVLSNDFYAYSFKEDFQKNPSKADRDINSFIKKETNGLLDMHLDINSLTRFVLLNCFYLKDLWKYDGSDIALDEENHVFTSGDGSHIDTKLMYQGYRISKMFRDEEFTSFYANANGGTNIYFILPNDGYKASDVMSAININKALNASYYGVDEENKIIYHTSCAFPSFEANFDKDIIPAVKSLGVTSLFDNPDFSPFCSVDIEISEIKHVTKLKVDRKGIEGAAVSAVVGAGAVGPREGYTDVYEKFVVDKPFGYIVESRSDVQAFTGIVNVINKL